ncbi:MAG TPA: DUF2383 domain-containing protein [Longimicrobiaceae bacterium]|nr:DUF2383 domain-containing protein [Longimicrobiaceae bacterium]
METDIGRSSRQAPSADVLEGLNDLLQCDHDAVGSYEIAVEKLEDREIAMQIEGFRGDHERHIRELNDLILALGGTPKNEPHATAPLKQAIQRIAAAGGDEGILVAWRTNELQLSAKYDSYAQKAMWWPAEAKRVVDRNALDEERHYRWIADLLGDQHPAEVGAANRLREEAVRAREIGRELQERVERIGDSAREAVSRVRTKSEDGAVLEELRARTESEIRQNPGRAFAGVFVIGFVLGRIIR